MDARRSATTSRRQRRRAQRRQHRFDPLFKQLPVFVFVRQEGLVQSQPLDQFQPLLDPTRSGRPIELIRAQAILAFKLAQAIFDALQVQDRAPAGAGPRTLATMPAMNLWRRSVSGGASAAAFSCLNAPCSLNPETASTGLLGTNPGPI
jgi:hypothetical protein